MAQHSVTLGGVEYPLATYTIKDVMTLVPLMAESSLVPKTAMEIQRQTEIVHGEIHRGGGFDGDYKQFLELENVKSSELAKAHWEIGQIIGYYPVPNAENDAQGEPKGEAVSP
jgi:hypothetical protein